MQLPVFPPDLLMTGTRCFEIFLRLVIFHLPMKIITNQMCHGDQDGCMESSMSKTIGKHLPSAVIFNFSAFPPKKIQAVCLMSVQLLKIPNKGGSILSVIL